VRKLHYGHMKEQQLVNYGQNVYPIHEGNPMPDVTTYSPESSHAQNNGEKNPAAKQKAAEKPTEQKQEVKKLATTEEVAKKVEEGIKEFVKAELDKELLQKEERVREELKNGKDGPLVNQKKVEAQQTAVKPLELHVYFPKPPQSSALTNYVESFRLEAEGRRLEELETPFLTKHYLTLRRRAIENQTNQEFLSGIKQTLQNRGVDVRWLTLYAETELPQRGAADPVTIPNDVFNALSSRAQQEIEGLNTILRSIPVDDVQDQKEQIQQSIRNLSSIDMDSAMAARVREILGTSLSTVNEVISRRRQAEQSIQEERQSQYEDREKRGIYGNRILTREEKGWIVDLPMNDPKIEDLFNRMFVAADSRPKEQFREAFGSRGEQEFADFIGVLTEARQDAKYAHLWPLIDRKITRFTSEKEAREILHNANYAVLAGIATDKFSEFVQGFRSELADLIFSQDAVVPAMHFYEQALLQVREENGGYLPYEAVVGNPESGEAGRVERLTRQRLEEMYADKDERGQKQYDANGVLKLKDGMPYWKIDRAVAITRGLSLVTGRAIEISASSILPPGAGAVGSFYAQDIIKDLAPFRHLIGKYDIGGHGNLVLGYLLHRGNKPWTKEELYALEHGGHEALIQIVNGLIDDKDARFASFLNPWRVGGLFTRSTWRVGRAKPNETVINALGHLNDTEQKWVGTGIIIERLRSNLRDGKPEAIAEAEAALRKAALMSPTKLLFSNPDLQKHVLRKLGYHDMKDLQLQADLGELSVLQERRNAEIRAIFKNPSEQERVAALNALEEAPLDFFGVDPRVKNLADTIRETFLNDKVRAKIHPTPGHHGHGEHGNGHGNGHHEEQVQVKNVTYMEALINDFRENDWKIPYVFGTDDAPYDVYHFGATGGTGIARLWRDNADVAKSTVGVLHLVTGMSHYRSPADLLKPLDEIYSGVAAFDSGFAQEVVSWFAEGVMKFYSKDYYSRLPLGIGTLSSMITGKASFAQAAYGRESMAWDEFQLNEFTRLLRANHYLTEEQQHELQAKAGGSRSEVAWATLRTLAPLLTLALLYYLLTRVRKDGGGGGHH
jgi:hypothetical protein